jgi:hypothetical protein
VLRSNVERQPLQKTTFQKLLSRKIQSLARARSNAGLLPEKYAQSRTYSNKDGLCLGTDPTPKRYL